ncbi:ArsB/NhaD family transporter [Anaeromyxobacter terrae]|uniref:SLC13 family permease n=1 Tax=Anaeromyxobacter terrae TaxID=2925406 RepID=UPI001F585A8C|nr:SLC13 family permease [Anaeromyxobacter sp. SG22]
MVAAAAVFSVTYVAVAAGRLPFLSLDRPAAALLGAVLMVAAGVLSPAEAGAAVNGDTLGLLLGMMLLSAHLAEARFFRWTSFRILRAVRTPRALLWAVVFAAGTLSALLVNDTVCVMVTPIVLSVVEDAELPPLPYLLALAFGSNAGSVATLTGNPQNMIVGTLSGISYARFAAALALPALASLVVVALVLQRVFREDLPRRALTPTRLEPPELDLPLLARALGATTLAVAGFLAGFPLAWTALFAAALCMAVAGRAPREALQRVDWPLLVFFAGLFVVVAGVGRSGIAARMYDLIAPALGGTAPRQALAFGGFAVVASQIVSNVPFVLLAGEWIPRLAEPRLLWLATALAATLAGNLTVLGSVANLIVLELAGSRAGIGFWRFFRIGAVVTASTLAVAFAILLAERAAGLV